MFISIGGSSCTNCATEKFDWELFTDNIWKQWNSKRDLEGKTKPDTKDIISNSVCSTFEMHFWLQILREILNNIIGGRVLFKVLHRKSRCWISGIEIMKSLNLLTNWHIPDDIKIKHNLVQIFVYKMSRGASPHSELQFCCWHAQKPEGKPWAHQRTEHHGCRLLKLTDFQMSISTIHDAAQILKGTLKVWMTETPIMAVVVKHWVPGFEFVRFAQIE